MLMDQTVDSEEMKLHKIEAVKLVRQAIDKILLDCKDSSLHDQYNIGNVVLKQESKEKGCSSYRENSLPTSTDPTKDNYKRFGRVKEHKSHLNPEIQVKSDKSVPREGERMTLRDSKLSNPKPGKNWKNLRKMILLGRFIKALETKVSNFNPQERCHLPGMEPEKVNLKHQNMVERKCSEEYLPDYSLQIVVSRLDPEQKRKVHLLVEAFETITPLGK